MDSQCTENDNVFIHRIMVGVGIVWGFLGAGASSEDFMTMFCLSFFLGLLFIIAVTVMLPNGEQLHYDEKQSNIHRAAAVAVVFNLTTFFVAYGVVVVISSILA